MARPKTISNDPGGNAVINGGPGANTVVITATTGNGVAINGGGGTNTYVIDIGSLAGPVTIANSNSGASDTLVINGAAGDNVIQAAGSQIIGGTQTINFNVAAPLADLTIPAAAPGNNQITVANLTTPVQVLDLNGGSNVNTFILDNVGPNVAALTITETSAAGSNQVQVQGSLPPNITVPSAPPVVNLGPNGTSNGTFTRLASFVGTGSSFTATVDYGDGSGVQPLLINPDNTFNLNHVYLTSGTYSPTVQIVDNSNGNTGSGTFSLTVSNVSHLTITWARGADITYGTKLTKAHQLNATADVAGKFSYAPARGTILGAGVHTLTVTFTPKDTIDYLTTTATVTINVAPANQTITWAAPTTIVYGTLLSGTQLDATVSGITGGSGAERLSYNLSLGTLLGAGNGQVLTVTAAATANYNEATKTVHINVLKTDTTTGLVLSSPNPSIYGQAMNLSVMVSANNPGARIPTGTVKFFDASKLIGTGTLDNTGQATLSIATLMAGSHSFTASYLGDSNDNSSVSASAASQTVNQAATTTALDSSFDPSDVTNAVTFTATVNYNSGLASPTGSVTFMDGAITLGTGNLVNGVATFKTKALAVGNHPITAVYNGDTDYQGSTSDVVTQIVNPLTDLAVTMSGAGTVKDGKNLTYTIKVTNKGPSTATDVDLTDILSAGVTYISSSTTQGTVEVSGNSVLVLMGTLASGDSVTIKIVVDPTTVGSITDTASVTGDQTDSNLANNMATVVTTVI